jgi:hypothetical protein
MYDRIILNRSGGPRIGFCQSRKLYWSWSDEPIAALQREWGTSVQPLKKLTANGKNIQVPLRKLAANRVESGKNVLKVKKKTVEALS